MVFNSLEFILFFPMVALLYFSLPSASQRWVLLIASYVFYMAWVPVYAVLILASTVVDYAAGLGMAGQVSQRRKLAWLITSLVTNLGLLFSFKYYDFAARSTQWLGDAWGLGDGLPILHILLPVGISFYTFQSLSYTIDVYRGEKEPERNFGTFALYVAFFPQLVAGPIERAGRLLPQLKETHRFDGARAVSGMRLMLWGLFKKIVIADRLALAVDAVYAAPEQASGPVLAAATVCFAFQIYCDFSGYTDIAIGAARFLGIDLMQNFRRPYAAVSIPDFWRRWHISLTTWFRDYVYISAGGNRAGAWMRWRNVLLVFALSGLWHGANWTFLAWGLYHAGLFGLHHATAGIREKAATVLGLTRVPWLHRSLQVLVTFLLVCVGWVFFRAQSLTDAMVIFSALPTGWGGVFRPGGVDFLLQGLRMLRSDLVIVLGALALMEAVEWVRHRPELGERMWQTVPGGLRWAGYLLVTLVILRWGTQHDIAFIYFQF